MFLKDFRSGFKKPICIHSTPSVHPYYILKTEWPDQPFKIFLQLQQWTVWILLSLFSINLSIYPSRDASFSTRKYQKEQNENNKSSITSNGWQKKRTLNFPTKFVSPKNDCLYAEGRFIWQKFCWIWFSSLIFLWFCMFNCYLKFILNFFFDFISYKKIRMLLGNVMYTVFKPDFSWADLSFKSLI